MATDSTERSDSALKRLFYRHEKVPLVYWDEFSGAKTAVALVGIVAVVTFLTGLSNLSQPEITLDGPLAPFIPDVEAVQFGGVLLSFVLASIVLGLVRSKRLAWYLAVLVVPLTTISPLTTLRPAEIPLLILVLVTVPLLILHRDAFDQRIDLSPLQIAALSSVVGVLLYGTIGSYAIRDQFVELETWADAVYYVLVTIATVGYGDITPTTTGAKWFSLSIIVFGTGAFTAAIGALVVPAIEKRMANALGNMTASELSLLDDHVLVLGYTDVTESLLEAIGDETDVVVVTENEDAASSLADRDINVLTADPATESTLQDAKIEAASGVVVATHDDANTVLTVLATRKAHPDVRIVAAAADRRHADKLEAVGADTVVSPVEIGGRLLGRSILEETDTDTLLGVDDEESNTKTDEDG